MSQRLVDIFWPGAVVEIFFAMAEEGEWRRGLVMALQHPGVWVRTDADGRMWYVTNGRRIRPFAEDNPAAGDEPA